MYLSLTSLTCLDGLSKFYPKQITTKSAVMWNKCCVHNKCIDIFYASPCKNRFLISTFTHSNTILRKNSYIFQRISQGLNITFCFDCVCIVLHMSFVGCIFDAQAYFLLLPIPTHTQKHSKYYAIVFVYHNTDITIM